MDQINRVNISCNLSPHAGHVATSAIHGEAMVQRLYSQVLQSLEHIIACEKFLCSSESWYKAKLKVIVNLLMHFMLQHQQYMVRWWLITNYPGAISILVVVCVVINTQRDERHWLRKMICGPRATVHKGSKQVDLLVERSESVCISDGSTSIPEICTPIVGIVIWRQILPWRWRWYSKFGGCNERFHILDLILWCSTRSEPGGCSCDIGTLWMKPRFIQGTLSQVATWKYCLTYNHIEHRIMQPTQGRCRRLWCRPTAISGCDMIYSIILHQHQVGPDRPYLWRATLPNYPVQNSTRCNQWCNTCTIIFSKAGYTGTGKKLALFLMGNMTKMITLLLCLRHRRIRYFVDCLLPSPLIHWCPT